MSSKYTAARTGIGRPRKQAGALGVAIFFGRRRHFRWKRAGQGHAAKMERRGAGPRKL